MKICLLGEYSGDLDEGMRKASSYFAKELYKCQHVNHLPFSRRSIATIILLYT